MLLNHFKSFCLSLLILLSTAGVFAHGFEHDILDDESKCTQLIHNQFEGLDTVSDVQSDLSFAQTELYILAAPETRSLQFTEYPYKNNSPPVS